MSYFCPLHMSLKNHFSSSLAIECFSPENSSVAKYVPTLHLITVFQVPGIRCVNLCSLELTSKAAGEYALSLL